MDNIGEIKSILNDEYVLITSKESLNPNEILEVYAVVKDEKIKELTGLEELFFPKGEISVVSIQGENIYLAKRFKEILEKKRYVYQPSLSETLSGLAGVFQARKREVVDKVPGPWSGQFDKSQSLEINFSKIITVGDLIRRI